MARADSKAVGGLHANGFAFVPQDRAVPPFPQHGIGRVVELGSFGFSKARLGKVALVEWLFCDVASPEQKSMLSSCIDDNATGNPHSSVSNRTWERSTILRFVKLAVHKSRRLRCRLPVPDHPTGGENMIRAGVHFLLAIGVFAAIVWGSMGLWDIATDSLGNTAEWGAILMFGFMGAAVMGLALIYNEIVAEIHNE